MYKQILMISFIGFFILLSVFMWTGIYHYDKYNQNQPVKINRFTGETQVLTSKGWIKVGEYQQPTPKPPEPPKENEGFAIFDDKNKSGINYAKYLFDVINTKAEGDGVFVYVTGEIKNKGKDQAFRVGIVATLYDESGAVSGSGRETLFGINPGESKAFRISIPVTKAPNGIWKNFKIDLN